MARKERDFLLPGGSKVEELDMSEFVHASSGRRRVRLGLAIFGAVAVAACVVAAGGGSGGGVELEAVAAEESLADNKKLPSWLRTSPVKLRPLSDLVREQQLDRKLAQGRINDKLAKEAHPAAQPSPKELAMRSVHKLAAAKQHHAHAAHQLEPVHVQLAAAAPSAENDGGEAKHEAKHGESIAAEIKDDKAKLSAVAKGEATAEQEAKKAEVHKLAQIKAIADKTKAVVEGEISHLKKEAVEQSEKKKLKAEMARVEEEEASKLSAIKKKLEEVGASDTATHAGKTGDDKVAAAPAAGPAADAANSKEVAAVAADAPLVKQASKQTLAVVSDGKGKKQLACDIQNCDMGKEDAKWLAHKNSVDEYAKLAKLGSGKQREQALAHMRALQHQIQSDFKHVTSFATAQKRKIDPNAAGA